VSGVNRQSVFFGNFFLRKLSSLFAKENKAWGVCLLTVKVTISGDVFLCILGILYMSVTLHRQWTILSWTSLLLVAQQTIS
jgi:hypothetical protein